MSDVVLQVLNATCERGGRALFAPVSFTLLAGQAMHLQGDNGAGKTSLLRSLCGLSSLSQGQLLWLGQPVSLVREVFWRDVFYLGHALGVIGGQVELALLNLPPTLPLIKSGRLKALAVSTASRSEALPQLPTIAEDGLPGYEASTWYGVMAPAHTPAEITDKIYTVIMAGLRQQETRSRIVSDGAQVVGNSSEEFSALLKRDLAKWTRVVKESGARPD